MALPNSTPSQAELKRLFDYDPETGVLRWKRRSDVSSQCNACFAGKEAGSVSRINENLVYRKVTITNRPYLAHRIIWAWMTGKPPVHWIDHRDGDGLNNRWANLRKATRSQNQMNRRGKRRPHGLPKGVSPTNNRYRAEIRINRKQKHLGYFATPEEAHEAYKAAAREAFGEYARFE